jgi:hypothetical protein
VRMWTALNWPRIGRLLVAGSYKRGNELSVSIKLGEFLVT